MICPKCNKQMINGYIPSNKGLAFRAYSDADLPENKTHSVFGVKYIKLSKTPVFKALKIESFYCSDCGFVIVPAIDPH